MILNRSNIFLSILFILLNTPVLFANPADYNNPQANIIDNGNVGGVEEIRESNGSVVNITSIMQRTIKKIQNSNGNFSFSTEENNTAISGLGDGVYEKTPDYNISEILDRGRNVNIILNPLNGDSDSGKYTPSAQKISEIFAPTDEDKKNFGVNKSHLTVDDMIAAEPNSKLSKGMIKGQQIRSLFSQNDLIEPEYVNCYISRKLTPVFYCPIESVVENYGGNIDMFQEEALKDCNDACKEYTQCAASPIVLGSTNISFDGSSSIEIVSYEGVEKTFNVSNKTVTKSFSLDFTVNQYADANTSVGFKKHKYFVKFDVDGFSNETNQWENISKQNLLKIDNNELRYTVFVSGVFKKIRIKFYTPFVLLNNRDVSLYDILNSQDNMGLEENSIINSIVVKGTIDYEDANMYYCPSTQFINGQSECAGRIVHKEIAGVDRAICLLGDDLGGPEPTTGAYYDKDSCERRCYIQDECKPTYTYPDGEGTMNIASYQPVVGCVDDASGGNRRCTQELCEKLFAENNETVLEEKNYYDEMKYETTVLSGITKSQRPSVDYTREKAEAAKPGSLVFIDEMKDSAYNYMANHLNYNYTSKTLGQPTEIQLSKNFKSIGGDYSLEAKIKPSNIAYDGGNRYFYIIVKMWQSYTNRLTSGDATQDPKANQDLELLEFFNTDNLKVFRIEPEVRYLYEYNDGNASTPPEKKWMEVAQPPQPINKKWSNSNHSWLAYDSNDYVHFFKSGPLSRGYLYEKKKVFARMYAFFQSNEGLLIRNQSYNSNTGNMEKIYNGNFNKDNKGTVYDVKAYLFYTKHPIKYSEVDSYLVDSNVFFQQTERHKFGGKITGDGVVNNKIEFYLQGKAENMSIYIKMHPSGNEVDKKGFIFTLMK